MGCKKEKAIAVIQDCYEGSLTSALEKHGVKAQNFFKTLAEVPSLDEAYIRAQHGRSELYMEQIIHIADTEDNAQKARNQIDARKLYASKMKPTKFGDRIDLNITQTVDIRGALDEARSRLREVMELPKLQLPVNTNSLDGATSGYQPVENGSTAIDDLEDLLS